MYYLNIWRSNGLQTNWFAWPFVHLYACMAAAKCAFDANRSNWWSVGLPSVNGVKDGLQVWFACANVVAISLHGCHLIVEIFQSLFAQCRAGCFHCAQAMPWQYFEATAPNRIVRLVVPYGRCAHYWPGHHAIVDDRIPILRFVQLLALIDDGLLECGQMCGSARMAHRVGVLD